MLRSLRNRFMRLVDAFFDDPKAKMKPDKIIVGLGNPGAQYRGTRHNVGFATIAELVDRYSLGSPRRMFHSDAWELRLDDVNVLLLCPQTFMNLSGTAVAEATRFYKLTPKSDLFVICDDIDLPVAKLRIRESAGSGGQKGLKDVASKLGSQDFARLRIGVGRPSSSGEVVDFVLTKFRADERVDVEIAIKNAADAAVLWAEKGCAEAMNKHNVGEKAARRSADEKKKSS